MKKIDLTYGGKIEKAIKKVEHRIKIIKFFTPKSWHENIMRLFKIQLINEFGMEIGEAIFNKLKEK